jgi:uncharacterized membrane protein YsdA (DUF1294 family)
MRQGWIVWAALALYAGASLAAFVAYGLDKSAARANARRIPETTLHLIALVGGWPGALIAQRVFHHKSRKVSFQLGFWITVTLNCLALIWFVRTRG